MSLLKQNLLFRFRRGLERRFMNFFNLRPTSYPYVSGDTFRDITDFIYEKNKKFDPKKVSNRAIIFVDIKLIDDYFKEIHPQIKEKYILITHNGDNEINEVMISKYLDNKIIHWFGQNVSVINNKVTPIPIGLENRYFCNNGITSYLDKIIDKKTEKRNRILFGFSISTNPKERQPAYDVLSKLDSADKIAGWPTPKEYFNKLAQYKFVASPPGNGLDCHRTWEAMYLGVIPIVKRSVAIKYFKNLGLPLLIIDNWSEIAKLDESDLRNLAEEIKKNSKTESLYFDYWKKQI